MERSIYHSPCTIVGVKITAAELVEHQEQKTRSNKVKIQSSVEPYGIN